VGATYLVECRQADDKPADTRFLVDAAGPKAAVRVVLDKFIAVRKVTASEALVLLGKHKVPHIADEEIAGDPNHEPGLPLGDGG
jgi:hypothetical protein